MGTKFVRPQGIQKWGCSDFCCWQPLIHPHHIHQFLFPWWQVPTLTLLLFTHFFQSFHSTNHSKYFGQPQLWDVEQVCPFHCSQLTCLAWLYKLLMTASVVYKNFVGLIQLFKALMPSWLKCSLLSDTLFLTQLLVCLNLIFAPKLNFDRN